MSLMILKRLKLLLTLCAVVPLVACQTTPTTATGNDLVCLAFHQMSYSGKGDTAATVEEVKEYNAKIKALCP